MGPCQPGRCLNGICSTESLPVSNKTVSAVAGDHGTLTQTGLTLAFDDMGVEAGCRDLGPVTAESRGVLRFVNPAVALPKGSVISGVTLELCHLLNTTNAVTLYETTLPTPPTSDFDPPRGNAIPGFPSYLGNTVAEESTAIPLSVLKGANIDLLLVLDTVVGCGMIATRRRYTAAPFGPKPGQCTSTAPQLTVHYCLVP